MKIEISIEEYIDRIAVEDVRATKNNIPTQIDIILPKDRELYNSLYDIHNTMWPLHDILMQTKDIELKAYLAEVILKLNGMRARLKKDSRTYA